MSDEQQNAYDEADFEQVTTSIFKFAEAGDVLIGKLERIEPFTEGEFAGEAFKYTIDTGNDLVSCVLGSSTDKQLANKVKEGSIVRIEFLGKVPLGDGRQVNRFKVSVAR